MLIFFLLFAVGMAGGYFYFSKKVASRSSVVEETQGKDDIGMTDDLFTLRVYYPMDGRLQMVERKVQRRTSRMAIAEAVIGEFLKGTAGEKTSFIPKDTKLLGLYKGSDGILYADLSDEFRRNFKGDAASEFLLLKGFFESLLSNVQDISDVKILIEGREIESLGGHVYLMYPLKEILSSVPDSQASKEAEVSNKDVTQ